MISVNGTASPFLSHLENSSNVSKGNLTSFFGGHDGFLDGNLSAFDVMEDLPPRAVVEFFRTYFAPERFATECVLAALSLTVNLVAMGLSRGHYYQHHAYHMFFKNMAAVNALSAVASWISNNSLFLFAEQLTKLPSLCRVLELLFSLNVLAMAFGLVSAMVVLGFGVTHYLGICWPLYYEPLLARPRLVIGIIVMWCLGFSFAGWPLLAYMSHVSGDGDCSAEYLDQMNRYGADTVVAVLSVCYVTLMLLCVRIYYEIRELKRRLISTCWVDDLQYERNAWCTLVLLFSTMTAFFLPFTIVYVVSMNSGESHMFGSTALLYYMNLLPYVKYATDPVIYGKRMLGLQEELAKNMSTLCNRASTAFSSSDLNNARVERKPEKMVSHL